MPVSVLPVPETGVTPNQARLTWNNQDSTLANEINSHEASGAVAHGGRYQTILFATASGALTVANGKGKYRAWGGETIAGLVGELNIAPSSPGVTWVLAKNGTALYTATVAAGTTEIIVSVGSPTPFAAGDILTVNVTGIGSPTPGDTLTVLMRLLA